MSSKVGLVYELLITFLTCIVYPHVYWSMMLGDSIFPWCFIVTLFALILYTLMDWSFMYRKLSPVWKLLTTFLTNMFTPNMYWLIMFGKTIFLSCFKVTLCAWIMDISHLDAMTSDVSLGTTSVWISYHILDIGVLYLNVLTDYAWSNSFYQPLDSHTVHMEILHSYELTYDVKQGSFSQWTVEHILNRDVLFPYALTDDAESD